MKESYYGVFRRLANQRMMELEAELEDVRESQAAGSGSSSTTTVLNTLNEQLQKNKQLTAELSKRQVALDELEPRLQTKDETIRGLETALADKEKDMRLMEERYKRYLEKAKSVSKKKESGTAAMLNLLFRR